MEPLEQEYRDEGCPNLNTESVLGGSDESFDFEILFEGFEKDFDLPAFFVDADDSASGEVHEVGNQNQGIISFNAYSDAAKQARIETTVAARVADYLIVHDSSRSHDLPANDTIERRMRRSANEIGSLAIPLSERREVQISPITNDNRLAGQRHGGGYPHIAGFGRGQQNKTRHVIVVVEQDVSLDTSFRSLEIGPGKQRQAQGDGRGIQQQQFVFEAKSSRPGT